MAKKLTVKFLKSRKVPAVLVAGLLMASVLGWTGWNKLKDIKSYYQIKKIFPLKTTATEVTDGDYQDDKFGRILAYVWIDCLEEIRNLCHDDQALVNEVMIKKGFAKKVEYSHRKKLKYDSYLSVFPTE